VSVKISVDQSKCVGHARCNATSPGIFSLSEDGYSNITEVTIEDAGALAARNGAASCPERAITVSTA
jgi:ferredoxin